MQPVIVKEHEKRRPADVVAGILHNLRYVLLGVLILGAVFIIVFFVWTAVNDKAAADSTVAAETVEKQFNTWQGETDAAKKTAAEQELLAALDGLISRYPRQYGGQRGLYWRAEVYFSGKLWDKAAADYSELAARFPQSYLAPISLYNAGVALEQNGDSEGALAKYLTITKNYKDTGVAPRALFDAGRLYEAKNAVEDAQKSYESLESTYPGSEWTKFAKNRVIALKVEGKIK
jgi:TolA-binding protein